MAAPSISQIASSARCMAVASKCAAHPSQQAVGERQQLAVVGGELAWLRHDPVEVLVDHRQRPLRQVAQLVGQVGVDPADDRLLAVAAVLAERHLAQQEVAHLVDTELVDQRDRVDHVADRLAHLLAAVELMKPCTKTLRGNSIPADIRNAGQYTVWNRMMSLPIMCRSAGQNLRKDSDDGVGEADAGQVVRQRVDPHVHDVVGMVGHRHAPVERGARDGQVAQAAGDEADDLVAPHVGPDELRVRLVVRQQPSA